MGAVEAVPLDELHSVSFMPDGRVRGAAVLMHGHGDYCSRYDEILEPFTSRGIAVFGTDLPGHGKSPGRRGFVPGVDCVDRVVAADHGRARAMGGPVGLIGHSAGGLLALREILEHPARYDFAWISSPLVQPEATRHPAMVVLLRLVARLLPNLDLDTGVSEEDCWHAPEEAAEVVEEPAQFHSRISLRWGATLVDIARRVREEFTAREHGLPVLVTQGGDDPVCPPSHLREFLGRARLPACACHEFPGRLHEPFMDEGREEVFAVIGEWIDRVVPGSP